MMNLQGWETLNLLKIFLNHECVEIHLHTWCVHLPTQDPGVPVVRAALVQNSLCICSPCCVCGCAPCRAACGFASPPWPVLLFAACACSLHLSAWPAQIEQPWCFSTEISGTVVYFKRAVWQLPGVDLFPNRPRVLAAPCCCLLL